MASNWLKATANRMKTLEESLVCPHCTAANRPGVLSIELDARSWVALCSVCAKSFPVTAEP
jgi:hypothetical protein